MSTESNTVSNNDIPEHQNKTLTPEQTAFSARAEEVTERAYDAVMDVIKDQDLSMQEEVIERLRYVFKGSLARIDSELSEQCMVTPREQSGEKYKF